MSSKISLTGGYRGYREAVREAFRANCHNPCIRYRHGDGFEVSSKLRGCDSDEFMVGEAVYCLNSGGTPSMSGSAGEYLELRQRIVAWIRQRHEDEQLAETIDDE